MSKNSSKEALTTTALFALLEKSQSLETFFIDHGDELPSISLPDYLNFLLERHQMTKQAVIRAANLERSNGYQIFNGYRTPRRNALLRIALGMYLTLDETQYLLKLALRGELYPRNRRDAAVIYCIQHRFNLIDTELMLEQLGEEMLE
ncbi:MAG: hypothetical protein PHW41_03730 [Eubacteriales bacterium]|nr:hypothetical protein [Eubacteriales bacterium]